MSSRSDASRPRGEVPHALEGLIRATEREAKIQADLRKRIHSLTMKKKGSANVKRDEGVDDVARPVVPDQEALDDDEVGDVEQVANQPKKVSTSNWTRHRFYSRWCKPWRRW